MTDKVRVKLIHEGDSDAGKLDDVRQALKSGDLKAATRLAKVYTISPVSV